MLGVESGVQLGDVTATVTRGRGLNAEELTAMTMRKLIFVGDEVPQPIRDQAIAYRDRMAAVVRANLIQAQRSERTTIIGILTRAGFSDAAAFLGKL